MFHGKGEWSGLQRRRKPTALQIALTRYITVGALRLLVAVHYVDISDIYSSGSAEKDAIVAKCIAARAPFCSPPYLTQFYLFYKLIYLFYKLRREVSSSLTRRHQLWSSEVWFQQSYTCLCPRLARLSTLSCSTLWPSWPR